MTTSTAWTCRLDRSDSGALNAVAIESRADDSRRTISVTGDRVSAVAEPLRTVLRRSGISGRRWSSNRPLELDPRTGEQAELLLLAVKPLRRTDRINRIAEGIAQMGTEEAAYWYAKSTRRGGLKALRTILDQGPT